MRCPKKCLRIVPRGKDLLSVPNDPFVAEQFFQFPIGHLSDLGRIELFEAITKALSFFEHGDPAQPCLKGLKEQHFEHLLIIMDRNAPFHIVIGHVQWVISAPGAAVFQIGVH